MAFRFDGTSVATEQIEDAAKDGDLALVRKLLDEGANLEGPDDSWTTPLWWACRVGYDDVERYLGVIRLLTGEARPNCVWAAAPRARSRRSQVRARTDAASWRVYHWKNGRRARPPTSRRGYQPRGRDRQDAAGLRAPVPSAGPRYAD